MSGRFLSRIKAIKQTVPQINKVIFKVLIFPILVDNLEKKNAPKIATNCIITIVKIKLKVGNPNSTGINLDRIFPKTQFSGFLNTTASKPVSIDITNNSGSIIDCDNHQKSVSDKVIIQGNDNQQPKRNPGEPPVQRNGKRCAPPRGVKGDRAYSFMHASHPGELLNQL